MHKLKKYLQEHKIKQCEFAASIGVSPITVLRYLKGDRLPCPEVMQKIVEYTGGEVQPNDFYEGE